MSFCGFVGTFFFFLVNVYPFTKKKKETIRGVLARAKIIIFRLFANIRSRVRFMPMSPTMLHGNGIGYVKV